MRKKFSLKVGTFLFSLILVTFLFTLISAKEGEENIQVFYHNIKVRIKGVEVPLSEEEEPFIYQGTVYVPLPFIVKTLGQEVKWDADTWTVVIGEAGETYLSDLKPYRVTGGIWYDVDANMWMGGKRYFKGFKMSEGVYDFNLNGQYTKLTGLLGIDDEAEEGNYTITFLGNGKQIGVFEFSKGDLPKLISLNVSGVLRLTIEVKGPGDYWGTRRIDFADALLK